MLWDEIKNLAGMVERGYKNISIINSDKRILKPSVSSDDSSDFRQFGSMTIIPRWIFETSADNSMVAYDFSNALVLSEKKYLIDKMEASQKKSSGILMEISYNEFSRILSLVDEPTDIFVPIDIFSKMYYFYNDQTFCREDFYQYLKFNRNKIRIHWSTNFLPFDKIYILNASGVKWIQRKVEHMTISRKRDPANIQLLTSEDDFLQISAHERENGEIGFLMRLVVKADIDSDKVKIIDVPKKLFQK